MTRRHLTIKPSCMREIATFPPERAALLWDEIDALVSAPLPDGKPQGCRHPAVVALDLNHWHVESAP